MLIFGDFTKFQDFATYIYWAPIFYNWQDRRDFLNIVEKFSLQNFYEFRDILIFYARKTRRTIHAIPSMIDWADKVPKPSSNELRQVFGYTHGLSQSNGQSNQTSKAYENSGGIYWFHRNCLHHYRGVGDQRVMEDLLYVFPDAIPEIFKALIDKFHKHKHPTFQYVLHKRIILCMYSYLKEGILSYMWKKHYCNQKWRTKSPITCLQSSLNISIYISHMIEWIFVIIQRNITCYKVNHTWILVYYKSEICL